MSGYLSMWSQNQWNNSIGLGTNKGLKNLADLEMKRDEAKLRAEIDKLNERNAPSSSSSSSANPIAPPEKQTPSWMSGYGSTQKEYDDAQRGNRVTEARSALDFRKEETGFNVDQDIRKAQGTTDVADKSFNFRQGVMEQIAQRQKATNTAQASDMWKNRNAS
jgi:hypothetical protein